jgi:hypothetical protein
MNAAHPQPPIRLRCGRLYATPGALDAFDKAGDDLTRYLAKHLTGDWGQLSAEDARANEEAITEGSRILSSYRLTDGTKVWIITEADRASTAILPLRLLMP